MRKILALVLGAFVLGAFLGIKRGGQVGTSVTVAFAGDVMLGRLVNEKIGLTNYRYPWGDMLPLLKNADVAIINLETTLTRHTQAVPKIFNFRAEPDRVNCLLAAGIDVVNLANNHMLDFGVEGKGPYPGQEPCKQ